MQTGERSIHDREIYMQGPEGPLFKLRGVPMRLSWAQSAVTHTHYEIAISARLLLNSFQDNDRPIHVSGQLCSDRLDAMMRIMEHELVHLIEMLTFGESSCKRTRFLTIADRLFGHTHASHRLITPCERAAVEHKLQPGDEVEFSFQGQTLRGRLNRINSRATVLVPDPGGLRYSDGKHYARYYVPLSQLVTLRSVASEMNRAGERC